MDDVELINLAAKAAGVKILYHRFMNFPILCTGNEKDGDSITPWDPLNDDGDALRLAVKLRIDLHTSPINGEAVIVTAKHRMRSDLLRQPNPTTAAESYTPDPYAATRRAIVRAAAEIGRGMP